MSRSGGKPGRPKARFGLLHLCGITRNRRICQLNGPFDRLGVRILVTSRVRPHWCNFASLSKQRVSGRADSTRYDNTRRQLEQRVWAIFQQHVAARPRASRAIVNVFAKS